MKLEGSNSAFANTTLFNFEYLFEDGCHYDIL